MFSDPTSVSLFVHGSSAHGHLLTEMSEMEKDVYFGRIVFGRGMRARENRHFFGEIHEFHISQLAGKNDEMFCPSARVPGPNCDARIGAKRTDKPHPTKNEGAGENLRT